MQNSNRDELHPRLAPIKAAPFFRWLKKGTHGPIAQEI